MRYYKDKTYNSLHGKSPVTRHSSLVTRFLLAFQFLTIIPLKDMGEVSEKEIGGTTAFFPLVGLVEGIVYAALAALFLKAFPSDLTNGLLVFAMILINGGLHMDGLSDTFDALASRGDKEKKLAIMKDGTVGPTGVTAIVLVILLKYLLLNAVFFYSSRPLYYVTLVLMPVLSRWSMVPAIYHCKSARQDGLGKVFIEHTKIMELFAATILAVICWLSAAASFFILLPDSFFSFHSPFTIHYSLFLLLLPALYIFSISAVWFFNKHFEGMTGDSFGTVNEIAALLILIARTIWSQRYT